MISESSQVRHAPPEPFSAEVTLSSHDMSVPDLLSPNRPAPMQRPISELLRRSGVIVYTDPSTSVKDAVATMAERNIGSILVLENQEDLVGIFTERDLMTRVVHEGKNPATTPIREVMTEDVLVVSGDTTRSDALQMMQDEHIRHLPVADDESLYGIVSLRDLLKFEHKMQQQEIEQLRGFVYEKPYPTYPG